MSTVKKTWIAFGGLALLALIIFFSVNAARREETIVQTSMVQRRDVLTSRVTASGEIRAKEFVDLQSEVAGVITDLPVREGDKVERGEILLRIDPTQTAADTNATRAQYEASVAEARAQEFQIINAEANLSRDEASLASSRAELELARSNLSRAESSFRRKQQLNEDGLISREDYEVAQNDLRTMRSRLEVAKAQVVQMETQVRVAINNIEQMKTSAAASLSRARSAAANLTRAEDQLEKTTLESPINGVITQLLVEKGERAVPGIMSNPEATLMTIADLSTIQAELRVDETDVVNVSMGDHAQVTVDALPDEIFEGEVTEIGNSPIKSAGSSQQESKDFKVIVTLKEPSSKIRPGMSCTGDIITETRHNVLVVPIQALAVRDVAVNDKGEYVQTSLGKRGSPAISEKALDRNMRQKKELEGLFVISEGKIVRFRPVLTGITGESEIEILNNLKEGEEVVTGSFQALRTIKDGTAVRVDNGVKSKYDSKG